MSGPVEVPGDDVYFFRDPAYSGTRDGRLYYDITTGIRNNGEAASVAYVVWRPAGSDRDMMQRLHGGPGTYITPGDIATDMKDLLVSLRPTRNNETVVRVERYQWKGDQKGNGRWVRVTPSGRRKKG